MDQNRGDVGGEQAFFPGSSAWSAREELRNLPDDDLGLVGIQRHRLLTVAGCGRYPVRQSRTRSSAVRASRSHPCARRGIRRTADEAADEESPRGCQGARRDTSGRCSRVSQNIVMNATPASSVDVRPSWPRRVGLPRHESGADARSPRADRHPCPRAAHRGRRAARLAAYDRP